MDAAPVGDESPEGPVGLTTRELEILAFERHWWKYAGAKEQSLRDRFGVSPRGITRF